MQKASCGLSSMASLFLNVTTPQKAICAETKLIQSTRLHRRRQRQRRRYRAKSFPLPLIHGQAGHRRSRGGRYANPRHHFGDGRSPRTRWPCEASNVPTFFDGAHMVYFVEEADFLIKGKFEETPEDNAENKHLIDEKRTPQCRKHAGLCQSDRYEKGCGDIVHSRLRPVR